MTNHDAPRGPPGHRLPGRGRAGGAERAVRPAFGRRRLRQGFSQRGGHWTRIKDIAAQQHGVAALGVCGLREFGLTRQKSAYCHGLAERILRREGAQVKTYEGGQDEIYADLRLGRTAARVERTYYRLLRRLAIRRLRRLAVLRLRSVLLLLAVPLAVGGLPVLLAVRRLLLGVGRRPLPLRLRLPLLAVRRLATTPNDRILEASKTAGTLFDSAYGVEPSFVTEMVERRYWIHRKLRSRRLWRRVRLASSRSWLRSVARISSTRRSVSASKACRGTARPRS